MADSLETESQQSLSEDEEETEEQSPSKDKLDSMDVDIDDEQTQDDIDEDKGNKHKSNARKRKSPDSSSSSRKKRKTDHRPQKLKIKIGSDELHFEVKTLQKIPFFKSKIIQKEDGTFRYKSASNAVFTSCEKFKIEDFEHMLQYINEESLDHIQDVETLETFVYCCDKFKIKLNPNNVEKCYRNCSDYESNDEFDIESWKASKSKILKDLYQTIEKETSAEHEEKEKEEDESKKKSKRKLLKSKVKRSVVPLSLIDDDDDDENNEHKAAQENDDIEMDKKEGKKKKVHKKKKTKRLSKVVQQINDIPDYLKLSDGDYNDNHHKTKEKSRRLMQKKHAIMTQETRMDQDIDDEEGENEEDENMSDAKREKEKQRKLNESEKHIKRLDDIEMQQISLLQSMSIRRLCRNHNIEIHKALSKEDKKKKKELESKHKKFVYQYMDDKKLIKKLKEHKRMLDDELNIRTLEDIQHVDDIGDLQRATIVKLCKTHRIKANQKIQTMIECLEERYENPVDEDAFIESLKDVEIDEIENLDREILLKLCEFHKIKVTKMSKKKKKKKKRRRKKKNDSDTESDEEEEVELTNEELITALEELKQSMNEKKKKRQQNKIDKLEQMQQDIVNIGFTENFLTISGSNTAASAPKRKRSRKAAHKNDVMPFKDDVCGLVALCNSIAREKGNGYSVVDDALASYKVVVSEEGARTIKVMMVIARGGSVVSKKWVNHSIKEKRWLSPQNYEDFAVWRNAANRSRQSQICGKRKRTNGDINDSEDEQEDDDELHGALFGEFSVYVQDRKNVANPSALVIKHLARCAGANVTNNKWKTERLKRKEVNQEDEERKKRKRNEEETNDTQEESETDEEEADRNKNKKKKKSKKNKRKYKVIISHSAIYKRLKIKKSDKVRVVNANWLFDCIENYKIVPFESKYIVKPNKQQSTSPVH